MQTLLWNRPLITDQKAEWPSPELCGACSASQEILGIVNRNYDDEGCTRSFRPVVPLIEEGKPSYRPSASKINYDHKLKEIDKL